jgi:hypothetical protein
MPQIPLYDGPQVQTRALRPVFQRAPDVSSGTQALARAVGQLGDIAEQRVRRDAEVEANRIDADITGGWLAWDSAARRDPKYRGEGVVQYEADAAKWWEDAKKTYGTDANGLVREQIGVALARKRNQAMGSVMGYVTQERKRFADDQYEASAKSSIEFAIDTGDTAGAATRLRQMAAVKGTNEGWTTEMVQAEQQRLLGTLHLSHIETVAERNAKAARDYYEANKREIPGQVQARVEKMLNMSAANQSGRDFALSVATLPYSERLKRAGDIADPEVKKSALAAIDADEVRIQRARNEASTQLYGQMRLAVLQGRQPSPVQMASLAELDPIKAGDLEVVMATKLKADQAAVKGSPVKTDWATYEQVAAAIARGENIEVYRYQDRIAAGEIEKLIDQKVKRETPAKAIEVATTEQQLNAFLAEQQFSNREKGMFRDAVYDRLNEFATRNRREATYDERKAIINALNTEIVTSKGVFWDSKDPAFKADEALRNRALEGVMGPQQRTGSDRFVVGQVYRDANGRQATYRGNGQWEPVARPAGPELVMGSVYSFKGRSMRYLGGDPNLDSSWALPQRSAGGTVGR